MPHPFRCEWHTENTSHFLMVCNVHYLTGCACKEVCSLHLSFYSVLKGTGNTLCNILIKSACGVNSVTALPCSEPNGQLAMRFYLVWCIIGTYDELKILEAKLRGENENEETGKAMSFKFKVYYSDHTFSPEKAEAFICSTIQTFKNHSKK